MDANLRAGADGRQRLPLREDFRIGADSDFEVLRPDSLRDQDILYRRRLWGTGADIPKVVPNHRDDRLPNRFRFARVSPGLLLDDAFEQACDKRHAARLDRLEITGREKPGGSDVSRVLR